MAEDTVVEQVEGVVEEQQEQTSAPEPQLSEDEKLAMSHGWKPKEQWEGPEDDWVSARQFNQRGELFSRISKLQRQAEVNEQSVKKLVEHNKQLFEAGYQKALRELKAEKRTAIENGDAARALEIDDQTDSLKEDFAKASKEFENSIQVTNTAPANPSFDRWVANNEWYTRDKRLSSYADGVAKDLWETASSRGEKPDYNQILIEVSKEVRERFPEKFQRNKPPSGVDGGSNSKTGATSATSRGNTPSWDKLPAEAKEIGATFVKSGIMTRDEYAKQFFQINS